jgi:hypothetical protein
MESLDKLDASKWTRLERLSFFANKLTSFPPELLKLPALKSLQLGRNAFTTPLDAALLPQNRLAKNNATRFKETKFCKSTGSDLVDRIKGCVIGNAIGDAIGLAGEFMNSDQVRHYYQGDPINYESIIRYSTVPPINITCTSKNFTLTLILW